MNGYISYMDVLGFNKKIKSLDFKIKYESLITKIGNEFHSDSKATIYVVSDSIIVASEEFLKVKAYARMIYEWGMRDDFWIRGAIAHGYIETIDSDTIVRKNKNIIMPYLGDAYLMAYNLESKLNMAGIVIDENVSSDNPELSLLENEDYVEYQEYVPKEGNESRKKLLLPSTNNEIYITDSLHFKEMMGSHSDDIDKYINTFCFFVKLLMMRTDIRNVSKLLNRLIAEVNTYSGYLIIPQKVVILFIAVIDGLFECFNNLEKNYSESLLKSDISMILGVLKAQGYLPAFSDYLVEFDKKKETTLYKNIHDVLSR